MRIQNKEIILAAAQKHSSQIVGKIKTAYASTKKTIKRIESNLKKAEGADRIIETQVLEHVKQRVTELKVLKSSPYFVSCEVELDGNDRQEIYFAKFNFSENDIFSWIAPAASIRFASPGEIMYRLPNGVRKYGKLYRKDQFMITDGKIIFMARESLGSPRQLIHQEHLSRSKDTFALPEIVEQMEQKQDEVIRADFRGSYLISGPAGSGKTTLALHRAAYLALSPDTSAFFPSTSIIVFVHDNSTKQYFSSLLPQLGINHAEITIFSDWAMNILKLSDFQFVYRYGENEEEKDKLEYHKNKILKSGNFAITRIEEISALYSKYLDAQMLALFRKQQNKKFLDRFDLSILLLAHINTNKGLKTLKTFITKDKQGREIIKRELRPLEYSLIIIDEAENYLKEQIEMIKSCADKKQAVLYVGDLAQQTKLGTIKDWQEVGESFSGDRKVELFRVYRNTREILEFIRSDGYAVSIPNEIKSGEVVTLKLITKKTEEEKYIEALIENNKNLILGIIHMDSNYLRSYQEKYQGNPKIKVLSIDEAQGVEFDVVIFLDYTKSIDYSKYETELAKEKERVLRDLRYVAMTRAMSKLYVLQKK